ncbi:phage head-tail joining protein [Pseudotabrizicola algicola]|uniref:Uncharacterized protein n=1 Tax=Pseudotabrizicola algicola TaxID=2709381 RepID=A0A6B3RQ57_9RHOB|nr:hypothetical protein [Pseudotabrizicola algicola]NEX45192.1 hypothetical protein [Pseudotabrizicola algicola]
MAFTVDDIANLERAIATGALKARMSNGEEVTYRSLDEMRKTLVMMREDVLGTPSGGVRVTYPRMNRGL